MTKTSKGGKGGKGKQQEQQSQNPAPQVQQPITERVEKVKSLWQNITHQERVELLSVDLSSLRLKARKLAEQVQQMQQQAAAGILTDPDSAPLAPMPLMPLIVQREGVFERTLEEVLDEGVARLSKSTTWKLWNWSEHSDEVFVDAEEFRNFISEKHIPPELKKHLPRDDLKSPEKPAEAAFRNRMTALLQKVQQSNMQTQEEAAAPPPKNHHRRGGKHEKGGGEANAPASQAASAANYFGRDPNIAMIHIILEALERENEFLYQSLLQPVAAYVHEVVLSTGAMGEPLVGTMDPILVVMSFEDLEKIPAEDAAILVEWLTEKVDALSTKLKTEPKEGEAEEDEENIGDVDLWSLVMEDGGEGGKDGAPKPKALTVNEKWLQHLQERLLGEDGHPRKAKPGEDPHTCGLVLEWVFGSIVSTAEKARDGAKRPLGSYLPSGGDALNTLLRALEEHHMLEQRRSSAKDLMGEMLKSRIEIQELGKVHDVRPVPQVKDATSPSQGEESSPDLHSEEVASLLPDNLVTCMLKREVLLTKAKLHWLTFEHMQLDKLVRSLKTQLKQGEPEFERLKRELEELKHASREMERHRSQLADAAIEEQLEVQTAFREQGAKLQNTYEQKQKNEFEVAKRETEIKQLSGWKNTVEGLIERVQQAVSECKLAELADAEGKTKPSSDIESQDLEDESQSPQCFAQLAKVKAHFQKDVRKQLYGDSDDKTLFENLKQELKVIDKKIDDSRVALQHLEMHLLNASCDDPGAVIGLQLALPILQERLDARALQFAEERAKMAEDEIIRMETEQKEREAAEREKKLRAKHNKKEKVRDEKERAAAEKAAVDAAKQERQAAEEAKRRERDEADRLARLEQLERLRLEEEELMDRRRQELLSDENGYWRLRMEAAERDDKEESQQPEGTDWVIPEDVLRALSVADHESSEVDGKSNGFIDGKKRRGKRLGGDWEAVSGARDTVSTPRNQDRRQDSSRVPGGPGDRNANGNSGRNSRQGRGAASAANGRVGASSSQAGGGDRGDRGDRGEGGRVGGSRASGANESREHRGGSGASQPSSRNNNRNSQHSSRPSAVVASTTTAPPPSSEAPVLTKSSAPQSGAVGPAPVTPISSEPLLPGVPPDITKPPVSLAQAQAPVPGPLPSSSDPSPHFPQPPSPSFPPSQIPIPVPLPPHMLPVIPGSSPMLRPPPPPLAGNLSNGPGPLPPGPLPPGPPGMPPHPMMMPGPRGPMMMPPTFPGGFGPVPGGQVVPGPNGMPFFLPFPHPNGNGPHPMGMHPMMMPPFQMPPMNPRGPPPGLGPPPGHSHGGGGGGENNGEAGPHPPMPTIDPGLHGAPPMMFKTLKMPTAANLSISAKPFVPSHGPPSASPMARRDSPEEFAKDASS